MPNIAGFDLTEHQATVLGYFAGLEARSVQTTYTVDSYGRTNYTFDTRSATKRVMLALAKKGLFTSTTETYRPQGWDRDLTREVFALVPAVVEHFRECRALREVTRAERAKAAAERDARITAERDAERAEQQARALAVDSLINAHPEQFEALLRTARASMRVPSIPSLTR
jgi:hypothetical protein